MRIAIDLGRNEPLVGEGACRARHNALVRQPGEDEARKGAWRLLDEALERLAWPASDQIAWLGSVMCADELALDFDHAYGVSWMAQEAGWISDELSRHLAEIDRLAAELTEEGPEPWSSEGLRSHPTWASLRVLACRTLILMRSTPGTRGSEP